MTPDDKALCEDLRYAGRAFAADRIEALAVEIERLRAKLADALDCVRQTIKQSSRVVRIQQEFADDLADRDGNIYEQFKDFREQFYAERVERDALRAVLDALRPIAESMRDQDNRATSHPMYVVETKTGRMGQYDFVTAFFSEREADAYVLANAHNLKKPRVFVYSAHRNREWQAVRACLLALLAEHGVTLEVER